MSINQKGAEMSPEVKKMYEEIKDAEEELDFLSEYEELLQCDLEETKQGGVYGDILERLQKQIHQAENIVEFLDKSSDEEFEGESEQGESIYSESQQQNDE